jgi:hypothetical protein
MNTAEAMQVMREREPLWREGMTPAEYEAEIRECERWSANADAWRAAGNRPVSELPRDYATERKLLMQRRRNKKYRDKIK